MPQAAKAVTSNATHNEMHWREQSVHSGLTAPPLDPCVALEGGIEPRALTCDISLTITGRVPEGVMVVYEILRVANLVTESLGLRAQIRVLVPVCELLVERGSLEQRPREDGSLKGHAMP